MAFDPTRISLGLSITLDPKSHKTILRGMGVVPNNCFKKDGTVVLEPLPGAAADPAVLVVQCVAKPDHANRLRTAVPTPVEFRKVLRPADLKGVTAVTGWLLLGDQPVASASVNVPEVAHLKQAADFAGETVVAAATRSPFMVATTLVSSAAMAFTPKPLPSPNASVGGFGLPGAGNFPGKGAVATYHTRPVDEWDLISKIHDFLYEVNDVTFVLSPQANPAATSRQAKADYLFRVLTLAIAGTLTLPQRFWNTLANRAFKGETASDFIKDDGFANVLLDPGFTSPKYLFVPYNALPEDEQLFEMIVMNPGAHGQLPTRVRINDYESSFPDDNDWEAYPRRTFGPAWDVVKRITSDADSSFR